MVLYLFYKSHGQCCMTGCCLHLHGLSKSYFSSWLRAIVSASADDLNYCSVIAFSIFAWIWVFPSVIFIFLFRFSPNLFPGNLLYKSACSAPTRSPSLTQSFSCQIPCYEMFKACKNARSIILPEHVGHWKTRKDAKYCLYDNSKCVSSSSNLAIYFWPQS